jgi:hypothetical protein
VFLPAVEVLKCRGQRLNHYFRVVKLKIRSNGDAESGTLMRPYGLIGIQRLAAGMTKEDSFVAVRLRGSPDRRNDMTHQAACTMARNPQKGLCQ